MVDVSINWATERNSQIKLLDTWKVPGLTLPRQEMLTTLSTIGKNTPKPIVTPKKKKKKKKKENPEEQKK